MWEQAKWAMVESARKVRGSVRVGDRNAKSVCWNNQVKTVVKRKEDTWKEGRELKKKMQG